MSESSVVVFQYIQHKFIVFVQFQEMSEVIEKILDSTGSDQNETETSITEGDANSSSADKHSSLTPEQPNKVPFHWCIFCLWDIFFEMQLKILT